MQKKTKRLYFRECESSDVSTYKNDILNAGDVIKSHGINEDEEICYFEIELDKKFLMKFAKSENAEFAWLE